LQVEGAITVQPLAYEVKGFKDYFLGLTPFNNYRNPWFVEYWEQNFKVRVDLHRLLIQSRGVIIESLSIP